MNENERRTSSSNWSPVPSKQSIIVRLPCFEGTISSIWYLSSAREGNGEPEPELEPSASGPEEKFGNSG